MLSYDEVDATYTTSKGTFDATGAYVINCCGYVPNTKFLKENSASAAWLNEKGYIVCEDTQMVKGTTNIFAAGDVVTADRFANGERTGQAACGQAIPVIRNIERLAEAAGSGAERPKLLRWVPDNFLPSIGTSFGKGPAMLYSENPVFEGFFSLKEELAKEKPITEGWMEVTEAFYGVKFQMGPGMLKKLLEEQDDATWGMYEGFIYAANLQEEE